jgi:hypothetical protein
MNPLGQRCIVFFVAGSTGPRHGGLRIFRMSHSRVETVRVAAVALVAGDFLSVVDIALQGITCDM